MSAFRDLLPLYGRFKPQFISAQIASVADLSPEISAYISENWRRLRENRPDLFNGPVCRLREITIDDGHLSLSLARSHYSHYVATRSPQLAKNIAEDERCNALGLTAMVLTSDNYIIAGRRPDFAEQNPGGMYFVGGYAEPPLASGTTLDLFAEIFREVYEELALPCEDVHGELLGIDYDPTFLHPEAFFLLRTRLKFAEISILARRARDRAEMSELFAVPFAKLCADSWIAPAPLTWSFVAGMRCLRAANRQLENE